MDRETHRLPPSAYVTVVEDLAHSDDSADSSHRTPVLSGASAMQPAGQSFAFFQRRLPPLRSVGRWVLVAAALLTIGWILWNARQSLIPFVIGGFFVYLLLPLVNRLSRLVPRWIAIILVYLVSLIFLGSIVAYIIPILVFQTRQLLGHIPDFSMENITEQAKQLLDTYERIVPAQVREPIQESINSGFERLKTNLVSYLQDVGTFVFSSAMQFINTVLFLLGLVVVPVWMFYVLHDYHRVHQAVDRVLPSWMRPDFWEIAQIVDRIFGSYLRGQILLGVIVGSGAGMGLMVMRYGFGFDIEYILLLAVVAGCAELIPVIGPVIGAIPAVIVGLFDSPLTALLVALLYLGVQIIESNVLIPRILGESVGIHPALLIILIIIASQLFGLAGVFFVAPAVAISRDVFLYLYRRLA
ncbi:MAG: AI-2E family transporter [Chloroflexaceae bacterium]|nr:AI-2E family transporter [Chloroflexaceae bacterium]